MSNRDRGRAAEMRAERVRWRGRSRLMSRASRNMGERLRRMINGQASAHGDGHVLSWAVPRHSGSNLRHYREWRHYHDRGIYGTPHSSQGDHRFPSAERRPVDTVARSSAAVGHRRPELHYSHAPDLKRVYGHRLFTHLPCIGVLGSPEEPLARRRRGRAMCAPALCPSEPGRWPRSCTSSVRAQESP